MKLSLVQILELVGAVGGDRSLPKIGPNRIKEVTMFVAGRSGDLAANNGSIILPETKREAGVTNFVSGNKLPAGKMLVVYGVKLAVDTTAAATTKNALWNTDAPAEWLNGETVISQNGEGVLATFTGTTLLNNKLSSGLSDDVRYISPFVIRPETDFSIVASLASTASTSVYKYEFLCYELVEEGK